MIREEAILIIENLLKNDKEKKLHISLHNRRFYNGTILNYENEKTFSFKDEVIGSIPILYSHILNIEPKKEKQWKKK